MPPTNLQPPNTRRIYQIEDPDYDESGVYMTHDLEAVYLSGTSDEKFIIIDTGSARNLIGRHLIPLLEKRLKQNGHILKLTKTDKSFQFGARSESKCVAKTIVPLNIAGIVLHAEVFIVDNEIPFLLGGQILRQHKAEIKTSQNTITLNGRNIKLELLPSGHMAINWTANMHEVNVQTVLMTTKVSRKDWTMPEVQAAMVKEIKNLQENGTYQEVPQEPWMVIVPSMWVIQRSAEDDGKQAGNLKARLIVR